jgi:hypothetical protein
MSGSAVDPLRQVAPDLGFTVRVPGSEWECVHANKHGYQCLPKGGDPFFSAYSVMVSDPDPKPFDSDQFVLGSVAGARERGWTTHQPMVEKSDIPFAGATHFTFESQASADGPKYLLAAYVGKDGKGRVITFMHVLQGTSEPPEFRDFVKSFVASP